MAKVTGKTFLSGYKEYHAAVYWKNCPGAASQSLRLPVRHKSWGTDSIDGCNAKEFDALLDELLAHEIKHSSYCRFELMLRALNKTHSAGHAAGGGDLL